MSRLHTHDLHMSVYFVIPGYFVSAAFNADEDAPDNTFFKDFPIQATLVLDAVVNVVADEVDPHPHIKSWQRTHLSDIDPHTFETDRSDS